MGPAIFLPICQFEIFELARCPWGAEQKCLRVQTARGGGKQANLVRQISNGSIRGHGTWFRPAGSLGRNLSGRSRAEPGTNTERFCHSSHKRGSRSDNALGGTGGHHRTGLRSSPRDLPNSLHVHLDNLPSDRPNHPRGLLLNQ